MILQMIVMLLAFAMPLTAAQEETKTSVSSTKAKTATINDKKCCGGCDCCRKAPTAAELTQAIRIILNEGILTSPQVLPQLIAALQQIIAAGGPQVITPIIQPGVITPILQQAGVIGPAGGSGLYDYAILCKEDAQNMGNAGQGRFIQWSNIQTPITAAPNATTFQLTGATDLHIHSSGTYLMRYIVTSSTIATSAVSYAIFIDYGNGIPTVVDCSDRHIQTSSTNVGQGGENFEVVGEAIVKITDTQIVNAGATGVIIHVGYTGPATTIFVTNAPPGATTSATLVVEKISAFFN